MQARAVDEPRTFRSRHCSAEEYDAFLASCDVAKHFVEQRRSHRKLFVQAWPDLEAWLGARSLIASVGSMDRPGRPSTTGHPIGLALTSIISR